MRSSGGDEASTAQLSSSPPSTSITEAGAKEKEKEEKAALELFIQASEDLSRCVWVGAFG